MAAYEVVALRAFADNYIWTIRDGSHAVVVDPGEAQPVIDYLKREKLTLAAILNTHHHADHVGGSGIGLANVRDRLEARYRSAARLDTKLADGGGFVAMLTLPLSHRITA
jgi:glyoxylase-like metal-dependent hydrolase (beta-lactamase superfamily II)